MEDNPKREIAHKVITICRRNGGLKTKSPTEDIVDIGYLESTGKKTKNTHTQHLKTHSYTHKFIINTHSHGEILKFIVWWIFHRI